MNKKELNVSKLVSLTALLLIFLTGLFAYGVAVGRYRIFPYALLDGLVDTVRDVYRNRFTLLQIKPEHWLQPSRYDGDGVTVNLVPKGRDDLILLQGFFGESLEIRLLRRDGEVVARWPLRYSEMQHLVSHLRRTPATNWNVGSHGAVALPDGSVVFNLDHIGLFKLDRCGELIWSIDAPTHHSVERNADGSFWVSSAEKFQTDKEHPHQLFRAPVAADTLIRVSSNGEVMASIDLTQTFVQSEELGLLTLTGSVDPATMPASRLDLEREIFHLNDVEELPAEIAGDFPLFDEGDLLVSLRNRNLLVVLDGRTHRIKWWHIGPWVRQHDPDWKRGGTITLFDNARDGTSDGTRLGGSRIVELDPESLESEVIFGGTEAEPFYSIRRGKHQNLEDSGVLITEAEAGRVFEIDRTGKIVWEYVNRFNESEVARITEARLYPSEYFVVSDWSCSP